MKSSALRRERRIPQVFHRLVKLREEKGATDAAPLTLSCREAVPLVRTIGKRYELRAEIASGGMATVHLARQVGAGGFARIVAVKRLHERYARDPDFVAMFLDEARLVARIRHPNVVQTIDVVAETGAGGGELFIVMEYVQASHSSAFTRR